MVKALSLKSDGYYCINWGDSIADGNCSSIDPNLPDDAASALSGILTSMIDAEVLELHMEDTLDGNAFSHAVKGDDVLSGGLNMFGHEAAFLLIMEAKAEYGQKKSQSEAEAKEQELLRDAELTALEAQE